MILHVEDAGGVVGALDIDAEPREPVAVVAQHRPVGRAVEDQRDVLHPVEEAGEFLAIHALLLEALELQPGSVERVPHLRGQRGAHGTGVGARLGEAVADRGRVVGVKGQEVADIALVGLAIGGGEFILAAGGRH